MSILIYLITPLLAIIFNSSAINPDFFFEWIKVYALYFVANFVFYLLMMRKNILQTMALGIFCYVPFTKAITAALLNRSFNWKATNSSSSDIVTKLVASFFPYLITSAAIFYLFATNVLAFQTTFILYAFWIVVNSFFICYLIVNCYLSVITKKAIKRSDQFEALSAPSFRFKTVSSI